MGTVFSGQVGPRILVDGGYSELRLGYESQLMTADARARYTEMAQRGQVWSVENALTGSTIVSGNVAPPAAAAAVLLGILNPVGSGVNLEIVRGWLAHISGTPGAGLWAYCIALQNATITAAANATPRNHISGAAGAKAQAYSQTALTGGVVFNTVRPFPSAMFAGALAATTPGQIAMDEVAGDIVVKPGYMVVLAPPAAGTTHVVTAGLTWAEVPALPGT